MGHWLSDIDILTSMNDKHLKQLYSSMPYSIRKGYLVQIGFNEYKGKCRHVQEGCFANNFTAISYNLR